MKNHRAGRETGQGSAGQRRDDVRVINEEEQFGVKRILLTRKQFPPPNNGISDLRYTEKALLRAVVAAGQGPNSSDKTKATRADANMRRNAIMSALDMSGSILAPTPEFLSAGSTDKATKSLHIGNALCAHSAYSELKIPWLVDIENKKLVKKYKLELPPKGKRPDFIGPDTRGRWFVFESKGRTTKPSTADLIRWKEQAEIIKYVKGKKVSLNIISAAYLKKETEWELLWVDPPTEDEGLEFDFDDITFFDAYYDPIIDLINNGFSPAITSAGSLAYIPDLDAYVGLHKNVLAALEHRDPNSIIAFARERINTEIEVADDRSVSIFADGILIALGKDFEDNQSPTSENPHGETPKPSRWSAIEI